MIFTYHLHDAGLFNTRHATGRYHFVHAFIYLFVKLIDNAFRPLQMQIFAFGRPIYISQFDAHLTNQQAVVLISPVNSNIIIHLVARKRRTLMLILGKRMHPQKSSALGYLTAYLAV